MPELDFQVRTAEVQPYAATPTLVFKLGVTNACPETIEAIMLHCQVRIETRWRPYDAEAQAHLLDLFGPAHRWPDSLRSLLWTQASVMVPRFSGETEVALPIACTYDFEVVAAKYFHALDDGGVPLSFLFSGTIFQHHHDNLQIAQVPWEKEAQFRLPARLWKDLMDCYFPNSAWLRLRKDVFDRLYLYKAGRALPTWEAALEELLPA